MFQTTGQRLHEAQQPVCVAREAGGKDIRSEPGKDLPFRVQALAHQAGDNPQQPVAFFQAKGLVKGLEARHVEAQHGVGIFRIFFEEAFHLFKKGLGVVGAGKGVQLRPLAQGLFRTGDGVHIIERADVAVAGFAVGQGRVGHLAPDELAVASPQAHSGFAGFDAQGQP